MTAPVGSINNGITAGTSAPAADSRAANRANAQKAAQQFEAMFINMMLKEARKTSLGGGLLDNEAGKTFREMQDGQIAQQMAQHGTLGLSKAIADYLDRTQPGLKQAADTETSK
jgi:peptidoglycan hydrolase FlgJ